MKNVQRAKALNQLLKNCNFPSLCLHAQMKQEERIKVYNDFKQNRVSRVAAWVGGDALRWAVVLYDDDDHDIIMIK